MYLTFGLQGKKHLKEEWVQSLFKKTDIKHVIHALCSLLHSVMINWFGICIQIA